MELFKTKREKIREREKACILREARKIWPMKEWRSANEFLMSVCYSMRNRSYNRTRWGLVKMLTAEGIYKTVDGKPSIDFTEYDKRMSES